MIESHGRMISVLGQIEISCPPELFLNDQSLLEKFEPSSQKLVLDLQEVALANVHLEGLVDDDEARIVLHVLPPAVSVGYDA